MKSNPTILLKIMLILIVSLSGCGLPGPAQTLESAASRRTDTPFSDLPTLTFEETKQSFPLLTPSETQGDDEPLSRVTLSLETTITHTIQDLATLGVSPGAYPGPEITPTVEARETAMPAYPGPGDQNARITDILVSPQVTEPLTLEGTPGTTPTVTPTAGLVQTQLKAADPSEFSIISGEIQLVEFFAYWSPISNSMAPVMNFLENKYQDQINFIYLDIDDPANSLFTLLLGNRLPPVFFLLGGDGEILGEWKGRVSLEEFESLFATVLASP